MIHKLVYAIAVVWVLSSCSSKKRATQKSQANHYATVKKALEQTTGLPTETGRFVQFPIASTEAYIATFASVAQFEMQTYGIPASITLAQGILESGSGKGALTLRTNNHFGIKCHTGWRGDFDFHDDDTQGECFRKYNHPLYSFRDHSIFLSSRARYAFLFNYRMDNYKKWAHGLQKAGYATDRKYPQKLIALIERYKLDRYDREVLRGRLSKKYKPKAYNTLKYVVKRGDTLYALSKKYNIAVEQLMRLNKLTSTHLTVGQTLKIQKEK